MVIRGARSNDRRMATLGYPVFRYRLTAFVIAGMICGLAGVLTATNTDFISPAMMHRSEEHTSELQSLMRISYAVFCLKKNIKSTRDHQTIHILQLRYIDSDH